MRNIHEQARPRRPEHPPIVFSCSRKPTQSHGSRRTAKTVENGELFRTALSSPKSARDGEKVRDDACALHIKTRLPMRHVSNPLDEYTFLIYVLYVHNKKSSQRSRLYLVRAHTISRESRLQELTRDTTVRKIGGGMKSMEHGDHFSHRYRYEALGR